MNLGESLLRFLGFFIAIIVYQATIIIVAKKRGDKSLGTLQRATLNPLPHIDILGTIILPFVSILLNFIIVFGWAKPHQIETRYFKKPRTDLNYVYSIPLLALFCISFACIILYVLFQRIPFPMSMDIDVFLHLFAIVGMSNMFIAGLFLLPFPGTSGWNLLLNNIPYQYAQKIQSQTLAITIVFLLLIVLNVLNSYFQFYIFLFQALITLLSGL
jgi:Zn-dependent protease